MLKQVVSALPNLLKLLGRLLRDARVPWFDKAVFVAVLVYLFFPLDIIPDVVPLAGQVDDLVLLALGIRRLLNVAGPEAIAGAWEGSEWQLRAFQKILDTILFFLPSRLKGNQPGNSSDKNVIDVEYRVKE